MPDDKEYLTQQKLDELKSELDNLRSVKRKEIAEQLEYAKGLGDLSENAEYHEARDAQANLEDRISRLEQLLKNAVIVSDHNSDVAAVGSQVTINMNGKEVTYTIVGSEEADMSNNKISVRSPFGSAVVGKNKGDSFTVETPQGDIAYKLIDLK